MPDTIHTEVAPLRWVGDDATGHLEMLDQRALPQAEHWEKMTTVSEVAEGIRAMKVRGAPAIGIAAAYGVALAYRESGGSLDETAQRAITPGQYCVFYDISKECQKEYVHRILIFC